MNAWLSRMLAAAGWLFILVAAARAAPPSAEQLQAWLRDLDAEAYTVREQASHDLVAAGEAAIEALASGVVSSSPEAAWRASAALEQIALGNSEAMLGRVSSALERLSNSGKPGLANVVQELRVKHARVRHDRAVMKIRSLGGKFLGDGDDDVVGVEDNVAVPAMIEAAGAEVVQAPDTAVAAAVDVEQPAGEAILKDAVDVIPQKPALLAALDAALKLVAEAIAPQPAAEAKGDPRPAANAAARAAGDPSPPPDAPPPLEPAADVEFAIGDVFIADAIALDAFGVNVEEGDESQTLTLDKDWRGGDAGLAALADLPAIVSLTVNGAELTDAALAHIAALPKLAELQVYGRTGFSAEGFTRLRQQRPTLSILAIGEAMLGVNADTSGPCVLSGVHAGSGAAEAGLAQGDEIIAVGGLAVRDFSDLTIAVFTHQPGEKLRVEFKRDGQKRTANVVLKDRKLLEPGSRP